MICLLCGQEFSEKETFLGIITMLKSRYLICKECQENFEKIAKAVDKNVFLVYNYMYLRECVTRGRDFGQYGKGNGLRNERRFVEND